MTYSASPVELVYQEFASRLNGFVLRRVRNKELAEDIVQDVFVRLVSADIDSINNISGWLHQVARNAIIDRRRSAQRRELPTEEVPEVGIEEEDDAAIWDEIVACLQPFLDGLGEKQREALEMTELGTMTQAEAADEVGISVAGMKSRVQRARRQLLNDLQECCAITVDSRGRPIEWRSRNT
ncbi:MAG: sigma-70 family RNA polymerase sigma factor [Acidimicrobiia bacterium]|nr:sigma-70 family RNA polymerase sigma factor [Acidimicrobiia bacterium]